MNKSKGQSVGTKLMVSYGLLILVICIVFGLVSTAIARTALTRKEKKAIGQEVVLMAQQIDMKLTANLSQMECFSRRAEFLDPSVSVEERSKLCDAEASAGEFYTVLYVEPDGSTILPAMGITLNLIETNDEAFIQAMETGESCYKPTRTVNGTSLMVTNAVPIKDDQGNVTGVIVSTVNIEDFAEILGTEVEAFIVDQNGDFIGHTRAASFVADENGDNIANEDGSLRTEGEGINISVSPLTTAQSDASWQGMADLITQMLAGESGTLDYTSMTGTEQFAGYASVPSTNWRVAYLVDKSQVQSVVNELISGQVVIAVGLIVLGVIFTFILANRIIKPLRQATDDLDAIISGIQAGEGDLTVRIKTKSKDEIGRIINGINKYTEVLQGVTGKIKNGTMSLNDSVKNMVVSIGASNAQATDTSAIMQELAASMEEVDATTINVRDSISQINEEIGNIAEQTQEGMKLAEGINQRAREMKQSSENNQQNTQSVISDLTETLRVSIENSKQVDKINELTDDILNIASQTNLLALNASIEAARAGEAGKGFAVVADEIRVLADNSRETANNIQQISNLVNDAVNELVSNTGKLLDYMNKDVIADYSSMVETGDAYVGNATEVHEMMNGLQASAEDIKDKIASIMDMINGTTQAINESAQGVAAAADNTCSLVSSISDINGEMENNKEVASNLAEEIDRFKNI